MPASLADLPGLIRRQRRAWQMSRAIETVSSTNIILVLQVLLVCLGAVRELLGACADGLQQLASPEMSPKERDVATGAEEFRGLLLGLGGLRRLMWRFSLSAELFLPNGTGAGGVADAGDVAAEAAARLEEIHAGATSHLGKAKAAWARVESELAGLRLDLDRWEPGECFEVGGGGSASSTQRHRSAPLCALCLLPAAPLGLEAPADGHTASALWKGGLWHVQCANFWIRHGANSRLLKDLGIADPFVEHQ